MPGGDAQGLPTIQEGIPGKGDSQQASLHLQAGFLAESHVQGHRSTLRAGAARPQPV